MSFTRICFNSHSLVVIWLDINSNNFPKMGLWCLWQHQGSVLSLP